jgi:hypothetical protein
MGYTEDIEAYLADIVSISHEVSIAVIEFNIEISSVDGVYTPLWSTSLEHK